LNIFFKYQTTSTTAAGVNFITTRTTPSANNQHIDFAASVHSERVCSHTLERVNTILCTAAICEGGESRPTTRVNAATRCT
jgi:hypothetical protein